MKFIFKMHLLRFSLILCTYGTFGDVNYKIYVENLKGNETSVIHLEKDGFKSVISRPDYLDAPLPLESITGKMRFLTPDELTNLFIISSIPNEKNIYPALETDDLLVCFPIRDGDNTMPKFIIQIKPPIGLNSLEEKLNLTIEAPEAHVQLFTTWYDYQNLGNLSIKADAISLRNLAGDTEELKYLSKYLRQTDVFNKIDKIKDLQFKNSLLQKGLSEEQIEILRNYLFFNYRFTSEELEVLAKCYLPKSITEKFPSKKDISCKNKCTTLEDIIEFIKKFKITKELITSLDNACKELKNTSLIEEACSSLNLDSDEKSLFYQILLLKRYIIPEGYEVIDMLAHCNISFFNSINLPNKSLLVEALHKAGLIQRESIEETRKMILKKGYEADFLSLKNFQILCKDSDLSSEEFRVLVEEIVYNPLFTTKELMELIKSKFKIPSSIKDKLGNDLEHINNLKKALIKTHLSEEILDILRSQCSYGVPPKILNYLSNNFSFDALNASLEFKQWFKKNNNTSKKEILKKLVEDKTFEKFGSCGTKLFTFLNHSIHMDHLEMQAVNNIGLEMPINCIQFTLINTSQGNNNSCRINLLDNTLETRLLKKSGKFYNPGAGKIKVGDKFESDQNIRDTDSWIYCNDSCVVIN